MNFKIKPIAFLTIAIVISSCNNLKTATQSKPAETEIKLKSNEQEAVKAYQEAEKREIDILHTKLLVDFNWNNQTMNGEAFLNLVPFFYPLDSLILDAKAMQVSNVRLLSPVEQNVEFINTGTKLRIGLPYQLTKKDTIELYIKYLAQPEKSDQKGSSAISEAKGLYFINHNKAIKNKPQQLWTQGETESNSVWFPTIDNPVEKTTQEIFITVEDRFKTLSNGELIFSSMKEDGRRTDYWKMSQPHSPYLFMMAVGEFAIVEDSWQKANGELMDVHYYVEPKYEEHALAIFGKTPKMLSHFSELLGVEYPWDKYHQVVVQDYVSGAMENTTATIHGDFLHQTKREIIDGGNESIIAHELFHHWFGDLVTCESWSNLPLNESFANYSQYLWDDFEYGSMEADMNAYEEMQGYFLSAQQGGYHDLIRFDYLDKEEMFDGHSYNKGGRILHMLRDYIGDEAFFEGLKLYLTKHAYKTAEAHDLRIAFEEVCGLDLNWFFNQWFFAKGHPILEIKQEYAKEKGKLKVMLHQKQDTEKWPLYQLPLHIDIYTLSGKQKHVHWSANKWDTIYFNLNEEPLLVNVDAHKTLLCKKVDQKSTAQWAYQLLNAPLWLDKKEAIDKLSKSRDLDVHKALLSTLKNDFWNVKYMVIKKLENVAKSFPQQLKEQLLYLAENDNHPKVRGAAIKALTKHYPNNDDIGAVFKKALRDSSYSVVSQALKSIAAKSAEKGLAIAKKFEAVENATINQTVAKIYADYGGEKEHEFFINTAKELTGFNKYSFLQQYLSYVIRQKNKIIDEAVVVFERVARNGSPWYLKLSGYQLLSAVYSHHNTRVSDLKLQIDELKAEGKSGEVLQVEKTQKEHSDRALNIEGLLKELRDEETNPEVLKYIR